MRNRLRRIAIALLPLMLLLLVLARHYRYGGTVIEFRGGVRRVGGSCILVETARNIFLLDCGSMGAPAGEVIPESPAEIAFAVVTHAHLDHCGLLPRLFEAGFTGKIYCTEQTAMLLPIMLRMTRGFDPDMVEPRFFDAALEAVTPVPFGERTSIGDVVFAFGRAGHLLGAAFVEVAVARSVDTLRLLFSGDLGSGGSLLLEGPAPPPAADYVVVESTYGGIVREGRSAGEKWRDFAERVGEALEDGGDVLVPAFALGRTQEVIAVLDRYVENGSIPAGTLVYVDSPTARQVNGVYRGALEHLSPWAREFYGERPLSRPNLREVRSRVSLAVHGRRHAPSVFVTTSGDLRTANSPRHLMRMFSDPANLLCIVGWVQPDSPAALLVRGESPVLLRYSEGRDHRAEWIDPLLAVERFRSFSSHADQEGLISWLSEVRGVRRVFVVHGEPDQSEALARRIESDLGVDTVVPREGGRFVLR